MQFDEHLTAVESWAGAPFAEGYRSFLAIHGGQFIGEIVHFYAVDQLAERNECYETHLYCPGFLAIGDDSGGRAIVINPQLALPPVFVVGHGSMSQEDFELVSHSLSAWVSSGCPLD